MVMTGRSGVIIVNVAGTLTPVFQARSVATTYRVYVPFISIPVAVIPVVVMFCICVPVMKTVYQDILASNPVHVNVTLFVVLIVVQLAGAVPVTDGLVLSIVKVIPVELPMIFESTKTY